MKELVSDIVKNINEKMIDTLETKNFAKKKNLYHYLRFPQHYQHHIFSNYPIFLIFFQYIQMNSLY